MYYDTIMEELRRKGSERGGKDQNFEETYYTI